MPVTPITIEYSGLTGLVNPATGQPVSGYVTLEATQSAPDATVTVVAAPVNIPVQSGVVNGTYYTNGQAGLQVQVTERIAGANNPDPYTVGLPTSGTLDLATASRTPASTPPQQLFLPASLISALGDLVVGQSAGTATRLAVGANNTVLTADSTKPLGLGWEVSAGGFTPYKRELVYTSGDVTWPNTGTGVWQPLTQITPSNGFTLFEIDVPAAIGHWVKADYTWLTDNRSGSEVIDLGVLVGTQIRRFLSTKTSTPAGDGDPGGYPAGTAFEARGMPRGFAVTSNDLDGPVVRFAIVVSSPSGTGKLLCSAGNVVGMSAENTGPYQ